MAQSDHRAIILCFDLSLTKKSATQQTESEESLFLILDLLAPNPEVIVTMLCDKLSTRNSTERPRGSSGFILA